MSYQHGIYGSIAKTVMPASNVASRGIQVVIGTAPVNLLSNPSAAVNTPVLLSGLSDVKASLGYSTDADSFTIMQAVHASFEVFDIGPIVAINVLDPAKHVTTGKTSNGAMVNGGYTISDKGVLLSTPVVKDGTGTTTYAKGTDYTAAFNSDGAVTITRIATGEIATATAEIETTYSVIDPAKVTSDDIVAGIAYVNRVFQATDCIPEILLAPGYAQNAAVGAALISAAAAVSTVFKATAVVDIDSSTAKTISAAIAAKTTDGYTNRNAIVCYPKVVTNQSKTVFMSAMLAALMQYTDEQNDSTPFISPSNKAFNILGTVLADKTSVLFTLDEANSLNAEGIFTALNFQGWKAWGDNTGLYSYNAEQAGTTYDPVDRYISAKRSFDWQNNGFITRYFSRIDNPANYRAIQTLITDENQFYNAFITAGMVAGMSIAFNQQENTIDAVLAGKIVFHQKLAPYIPLQVIEVTLQFDPTMLTAALGGASS
jgi:phage tail sheath protein FI